MPRLLIDTHIFLWWNTEPARLSDAARDALMDPANALFLSVVSLWEMQIKIQLGKLSVPPSLSVVVEQNRITNQLQLLGLLPEHIYALDTLMALHKDPFDRLLVAQTLIEEMILVTADSHVSAYPVTTLW